MSVVRAVLFDLDGVLVDSYAAWFAVGWICGVRIAHKAGRCVGS